MAFLTREYKFEANTTLEQQQKQRKDQRAMAVRSLRKLVKPLLRALKKKQLQRKTLAEIQQQNEHNASLEDMRNDAAALIAHEDNLANEVLEQRLYNEMRQCVPNAAVIVQQGVVQRVVPVHSQQQFIPVHFARTSSGTFFWTSIDGVRQQELQTRMQHDRWGQA